MSDALEKLKKDEEIIAALKKFNYNMKTFMLFSNKNAEKEINKFKSDDLNKNITLEELIYTLLISPEYKKIFHNKNVHEIYLKDLQYNKDTIIALMNDVNDYASKCRVKQNRASNNKHMAALISSLLHNISGEGLNEVMSNEIYYSFYKDLPIKFLEPLLNSYYNYDMSTNFNLYKIIYQESLNSTIEATTLNDILSNSWLLKIYYCILLKDVNQLNSNGTSLNYLMFSYGWNSYLSNNFEELDEFYDKFGGVNGVEKNFIKVGGKA